MFVALILLANIKIMFELIAILPLNICRHLQLYEPSASDERIASGRIVEAGVRSAPRAASHWLQFSASGSDWLPWRQLPGYAGTLHNCTLWIIFIL